MNHLTKTFICLIFIIPAMVKYNVNAQIQDIKRHSEENKTNHSNNNSSSNNSSNSNNDKSDIASGCISSLFDVFVGCLSSLPEKDHNNYNQNNSDDFIVIAPDDHKQNKISNQNLNQPKINDIEDSTRYKPNLPKEFSLDLNAHFAIGYQFGSDTSYSYYNFLPGLRANLAWFSLDFRYNILTQISKDLPDAFRTWDLLFLFNVNATDNAKIIFGTGMHHEDYSSLTFNEHFVGAKIGLFNKVDYLDINGRFAIDYKTEEFPFTEIGIHFNKRFINSKNFNGYVSVGGLYQNYYEAVDIWAIRAGVVFNWHN